MLMNLLVLSLIGCEGSNAPLEYDIAKDEIYTHGNLNHLRISGDSGVFYTADIIDSCNSQRPSFQLFGTNGCFKVLNAASLQVEQIPMIMKCSYIISNQSSFHVPPQSIRLYVDSLGVVSIIVPSVLHTPENDSLFIVK